MLMENTKARELFERLVRRMGMGEIKAKVRFENDRDMALHEEGGLSKRKVRKASVEAVIDTGAVMMLLPRDLVEALGLKFLGKTVVTLADDSKIELEQAGPVRLTIAGRTWNTDCLVGPPGCETLIGQLVLERLDLIVDPTRRTVTVRPESPWLPTLNLKRLTSPRPVSAAGVPAP